MAEFNFNKINIPTMKVILNDDDQTELSVKLPEKYIIASLIECQSFLKEIQEGDTKSIIEVMNKIFDIVADILSNNKEHIKVTGETLSQLGLGIDEVTLLFNEYLKFVDDNKPTKN